MFLRHSCGGGGGGDHQRMCSVRHRLLPEIVPMKNVVDGGVAQGKRIAGGGEDEDEDGDLSAVEQVAELGGLTEKACASL